MVKYLLSILTFCCSMSAFCDVLDPFDPNDRGNSYIDKADDDSKDETKSADDLLLDASILFKDDRPLDGRTKLLKALKKEPDNYRIHFMLAGYYMEHVGHFRLALKYVKQAQNLFTDKNGEPPYQNIMVREEHKHLLYLLAQARLNLDEYQQALDIVDEFHSRDYYDDWYSGTRAWILMKLGRLDEAIREARLGALSSADEGRILNMLGILLSMKGEREQSLAVFRNAITFEMSRGKYGQPATPLNNSGEVYREMFQDERAESTLLKALSQKDGCEHVLPSLNISLLYIDQTNFKSAKKAMDDFEACVAQYPLRNGEEHKALVHLIRGRVDMHTGNIDSAIQHLEAALQNRQWFGKIGTDEEDLEAGAMISLSQALRAKDNHMQFKLFKSFSERALWIQSKIVNEIRAWWLMRRARQLMTEQLQDLEDISIRNTDSMIEYSTFGDMLAGLPLKTLNRRIEKEKSTDDREFSSAYYKTYLAQSAYEHGDERGAYNFISEAQQKIRPQLDKMLLLKTQLISLAMYNVDESDYRSLAQSIFGSAHALLRNYGFKLPIKSNIPKEFIDIEEVISKGPFHFSDDDSLIYSISYALDNGAHILKFESKASAATIVKVRGDDLIDTVNRFSDEVFSEDLAQK